jgi:hypothetical protein
MKKPWKVRKLTLSRETLVHLDHLDGTQLDRVFGLGGTLLQQGCTASTCNRPCTCPV